MEQPQERLLLGPLGRLGQTSLSFPPTGFKLAVSAEGVCSLVARPHWRHCRCRIAFWMRRMFSAWLHDERGEEGNTQESQI